VPGVGDEWELQVLQRSVHGIAPGRRRVDALGIGEPLDRHGPGLRRSVEGVDSIRPVRMDTRDGQQLWVCTGQAEHVGVGGVKGGEIRLRSTLLIMEPVERKDHGLGVHGQGTESAEECRDKLSIGLSEIVHVRGGLVGLKANPVFGVPQQVLHLGVDFAAGAAHPSSHNVDMGIEHGSRSEV